MTRRKDLYAMSKWNRNFKPFFYRNGKERDFFIKNLEETKKIFQGCKEIISDPDKDEGNCRKLDHYAESFEKNERYTKENLKIKDL